MTTPDKIALLVDVRGKNLSVLIKNLEVPAKSFGESANHLIE
jgi:hypothetical protein